MDGKWCLVGVAKWEFGVDEELEEESYDFVVLVYE